jgi:hypothetical protein
MLRGQRAQYHAVVAPRTVIRFLPAQWLFSQQKILADFSAMFEQSNALGPPSEGIGKSGARKAHSPARRAQGASWHCYHRPARPGKATQWLGQMCLLSTTQARLQIGWKRESRDEVTCTSAARRLCAVSRCMVKSVACLIVSLISSGTASLNAYRSNHNLRNAGSAAL